MRTYRAWIVFAVAFLWFSVRASTAWLASGYVDPIGRFGTQDEAFYSRVVIEMLRSGNWLTPTLLDRLAYFKPPLLYWFSALSVFVFGPDRCAFRLPSILAGAGVCALSFHWIDRRRGAYLATLTTLLLAADGYLIMLSSVNMTDALAAFFALLAIWTIHTDTRFIEWRSLCLCGIALAAGVLTKSIAGLVPAAAIAAYWLVFSRANRPAARRMLALTGLTIALTAPWFIHALIVHGRWFWTEHVLTEIFSSGAGAGPLSTSDPNFLFYIQRLFVGDPITACVCLIGIAAGLLRRQTNALLLTWLILASFTLLIFRQHAATYLLPVIVAATLLASLAMPNLSRRSTLICTAALLLCEAGYLVKFSPIVWTETNNPQARALIDYCNLRRGNSLFYIEPRDEYYSALLPLPHVYFGMIEQGRTAVRQPIDWRSLGVMVTADQFSHQVDWWPLFRRRLDEFGLSPKLDPRSTIVLFPGPEQAGTFIADHPELDFYVPVNWTKSIGSHNSWAPSAGRVWLLARESKPRAQQKIAGRDWSCLV